MSYNPNDFGVSGFQFPIPRPGDAFVVNTFVFPLILDIGNNGHAWRSPESVLRRNYSVPLKDIARLYERPVTSIDRTWVCSDLNLLRSYSRPVKSLTRIWVADPMSDFPTPANVLYKTTAEEKTFGGDFQQWGPIKAGETVSDDDIEILLQDGSGVTVSGESTLDEDFLDAGTGKKIPAGKGVKFKLSGGVAGKYLISIKARSSDSNDLMDIVGYLMVTDTVTGA